MPVDRSSTVAVHSFDLFADYHQFYVWDAGAHPQAPVDYTPDDLRRRVKVSTNVVVIQPTRNMTVPVEFEVCTSDPGFDESHWDHIAECSLNLPTGNLQVHECTGGSVLDLIVAPGTYLLRALFAGLDTLSDDGLDGEDRYRIVLWPGAFIATGRQTMARGLRGLTRHANQPLRSGYLALA
jgi:hypothetical protein